MKRWVRIPVTTENRKIQQWLPHPVFGQSFLIPNPTELEEVHGLPKYRERFNPLRFYTPEEFLQFCQRDTTERTTYLKELFAGQVGENQLKDVIQVWEQITLPSAKEIKTFYEQHFGTK